MNWWQKWSRFVAVMQLGSNRTWFSTVSSHICSQMWDLKLLNYVNTCSYILNYFACNIFQYLIITFKAFMPLPEPLPFLLQTPLFICLTVLPWFFGRREVSFGFSSYCSHLSVYLNENEIIKHCPLIRRGCGFSCMYFLFFKIQLQYLILTAAALWYINLKYSKYVLFALSLSAVRVLLLCRVFFVLCNSIPR